MNIDRFPTRRLPKALASYALIGAGLLTPFHAQVVHAFEPLTTLAVSIGTSLVVRGFNFLFDKVIPQPDLHYETTKQIHQELREVHMDILENRSIQFQLVSELSDQIAETGDLVIAVGDQIKDHTERQFERERIVNVLGSVTSLLDVVHLLPEVSGEERASTVETLREKLGQLQTASGVLDFNEHLRAAMVLPRVAAIQAVWLTYRELGHMPKTSEAFVRRAGRWLDQQRHATGEADPVRFTLGDIIRRVEGNAEGTDRYLAELSNPCSPLWSGYLTLDDYEQFANGDVRVRKVGLSQAMLRPLAIPDAAAPSPTGGEPIADSPLILPTSLDWATKSQTLPEPVVLRQDDSSLYLAHTLERMHTVAFGCSSPVQRFGRARLALDVPNADGTRSDVSYSIPEITYDAPMDSKGRQLLTLERLLQRTLCSLEPACRQHWEYVHMRREIASSMLAMLYGARAELNRTLEWLAEETTSMTCRFVEDQPRVCLIDDPDERIDTPFPTQIPEADPLTIRSYTMARDLDRLLDQQGLAAIANHRIQASAQRARVIGAMHGDLSRRASFVQDMQAANDQHMQELAVHAARMAWVRLALGVVQDQLSSVLEGATEEFLTDVLKGDTPVGPGEDASGLVVLQAPASGGAVESLGVAASPNPIADATDAPLDRPLLVAMNLGTTDSGGSPVTGEYSESFFGPAAGLDPAQRLSLWLPEIPPGVTDFSAGMGDAIWFGLTKKVREWTGLSAEVDTTSGQYRNGTLVGTLAISAPALGKALGLSNTVVRGSMAGKKAHELGRLGNYSLTLRIGHGQRTQGLSIISHARKGQNGRVIGFDVVTKFRGPRSLASKLPHVNIVGIKAHLPWEPVWLVPAVVGSATPEAH